MVRSLPSAALALVSKRWSSRRCLEGLCSAIFSPACSSGCFVFLPGKVFPIAQFAGESRTVSGARRCRARRGRVGNILAAFVARTTVEDMVYYTMIISVLKLNLIGYLIVNLN